MSTLTLSSLWGQPPDQMKFDFAKSFNEHRKAAFASSVSKIGLQKFFARFVVEAAVDTYDSVRSRIDKKYRRRNEANLIKEWTSRTERFIIAGALGVSAFALLANSGASEAQVALTEVVLAPKAPEQIVPQVTRYEVIETGEASTKQVDFGLLAGRNFGKWTTKLDKGEVRNPNALYSGVERIADQVVSVNYCEQMKLAWQAKLKRKEITGATVKAIPFIINEYCNGTRTLTDLQTYVGDVDTRIITAYPNIDFEGLCDRLDVDKKGSVGCPLVREVVSRVRGEHVVAYGMTELLPKQTEGLFNARLLDQNLRYAGLEFWMSVPALGDPLASKGLFQFTSYAIGHDQDGRKGASVVNQFAADGYKTADSVVGPLGLKPNQHDRAAYYFVIYNVVSLVAKLDDGQRAALLQVVREGRMDEMTEFFATSHHAPGSVRGYAKKWLSAGAKKPFKDYLKGRFVAYGRKTSHNLTGLREFLALKKGQ